MINSGIHQILNYLQKLFFIRNAAGTDAPHKSRAFASVCNTDEKQNSDNLKALKLQDQDLNAE